MDQAGSAAEPVDPGMGPSADDALWAALSSAAGPPAFCSAWLALQCGRIGSAGTGLLLLQGTEGAFQPAAIWPDAGNDVSYLTAAAEQALREQRGVVRSILASADRPARIHVAFPILVQGTAAGVVVLDVLSHLGLDVKAIFRQLRWGTGWLEAALLRQRAGGEARLLARAHTALDLLAVAQEQTRLQAAAVALANEVAARYRCERVSLGFSERRGIRLRAISHTAWFQRKAEPADALENAMDEAFEQRQAIAWPAIAETEKAIAIAHRDLASSATAASVLSVLLAAPGGPAGVMTLERRADDPFDAETLASLQLLGALAGPVLELQRGAERLIAGRAATSTRSGIKAVFGPRRPALKLAVLSCLLAIGFLALARTEFRISASSVLEGSVQRAAVAPFDGFLAETLVRPGDVVREGDVLAVLDDRDLRLEKTRWELEASRLRQKHRDAQSRLDRLDMQLLDAQIAQAEAQGALAADRLERTRIAAGIGGLVVSGDLSQMLGAPVEQGKVLFEVAPLDSYRVVLEVDEEDMRYVEIGQRGSLALTGAAGETAPFRLTRLTSVASAEEGRNFFRVEAELLAHGLPLRPGMEGVGKVDVGERPLLWVATRRLIERTRLFLWAWIP